MLELMLRHARPAESTLWVPTVLSLCAIWRCRFVELHKVADQPCPVCRHPLLPGTWSLGSPTHPTPITRMEALHRRDCAAQSMSCFQWIRHGCFQFSSS